MNGSRIASQPSSRLHPWGAYFSMAMALATVASCAYSGRLAAEGTGKPMTTATATAAAVRSDIPDQLDTKLRTFLDALWPEAKKINVSKVTFDRAFAGVKPDLEIFPLLHNQPEYVSTPWDYINQLASDQRVEAGKLKLIENATVLAAIEQKWSVPSAIVLAIWGIESSFGVAPGTRSIIRSLATLAVGESNRPQFWRKELLAALTIVERGDISLEQMTGSWAGAMGHTQFMPTSFLRHAVDFDGDGRRNIWTSTPDALASTSNFLHDQGWQANVPWGLEVILPARFDYAASPPDTVRTRGDWQDLGLTTPAGRTWPETATGLSLVLPAGAKGPAFLVSRNFKAILKYNNSTRYALAVGHLADRIAGGPPIAAPWPTDDPPLSRDGVREVQKHLMAIGWEIGEADGRSGTSTKSAIREFQRQGGMAADGYPSRTLLERLRKHVGSTARTGG